MSWPSIDHGILGPSGHVSKRYEKQAKAEMRERLFPDGFPDPVLPSVSEREVLLRQARELRQLAARGMKPRAYLKRAEELERKADEVLL